MENKMCSRSSCLRMPEKKLTELIDMVHNGTPLARLIDKKLVASQRKKRTKVTAKKHLEGMNEP